MKDLIRELINSFFVIFTGCMLGTWIFCKIFYPTETFGLEYFQWMALFALAGDLPLLILHSKRELTEEQLLKRMVIHFMTLEVVLMAFAKILGMYENFVQGMVMALIILVVYIMVRLVGYIGASRIAGMLNTRLAEMNEDE